MPNIALLIFIVLSFQTVLGFQTSLAADDPLPSWNDTPVKQAIIHWLEAVTDPTGPDFVPVPERVAVFDNDGTFLCEKPRNPSSMFQVLMLRRQVEAGKVDGTIMPHRAWLADDRDALREFGYKKAYVEMNKAYAGMPVTAYRDSARAFIERSHHPRYKVPYSDLYYAPMLELATELRLHGFQLWVVTGSEQDFIRSFLEDATGVPPERIIGSCTPAVAHEENGIVNLVRGDTQIYNGHEAKTANIETRMGRRPIFCVGNSNNDQSMCRYTATGPRRSLALWIHHDDAEREYAYDRSTSRIKELVQEKANVHEVSIQETWNTLFLFER